MSGIALLSPLPPCGGGLGRGVSGENRPDDCNHAIGIDENVVIPETQHPIALRLKESRPDNISLAVGVLTTVDFDDQLCLEADKIDDAITNQRLAAKSLAVNLLAAQPRPQSTFSLGEVASQLARCANQHAPILLRESPLPNPPPQGGREYLASRGSHA